MTMWTNRPTYPQKSCQILAFLDDNVTFFYHASAMEKWNQTTDPISVWSNLRVHNDDGEGRDRVWTARALPPPPRSHRKTIHLLQIVGNFPKKIPEKVSKSFFQK